MSALTFF
jgi:hypothetical protein